MLINYYEYVSRRSHLLGLAQYFNSLVPSALVYVEQTELHQRVRHEVVVELDLLFTKNKVELNISLMLTYAEK